LTPPPYRPAPLDTLLEIPVPSAGALSSEVDGATEAVAAHRLMASVDAITGVLDMLGARLGAMGEDGFRGLVNTAQRQVQHVESALRAMVQGVPIEVGIGSERVTESIGPSQARVRSRRSTRSSGRPESESVPSDDARSRALRRLRTTLEAANAAQAEIEDVVALGRQAGVTWDEIAEVLGLTRQGAQKRYSQGRLT
jgi:hypothetical protein